MTELEQKIAEREENYRAIWWTILRTKANLAATDHYAWRNPS